MDAKNINNCAKNVRSNYWCFTINNPSPGDVTQLLELVKKAIAGYVVVGYEQGDEKETLHLQGYIELAVRKRMGAVKGLAPCLRRAHLEKRRGTSKQAADYCKKDGNFSEAGEMSETHQGKRSDLDQLRDLVASGVTNMREIYDECNAAFRYPQAVKEYVYLTKRARLTQMELKLRPWQERLATILEAPVDPRKVLWYWEATGATGKTTMARYLARNKGAFYSNGGKTSDIAYAYNEEPIVVFDFVRSQEEHINYGIIEALKNGMVTSNKYQSCTKIFDIPHVVVFANFQPDVTKLSEDRWEIVEIIN